MMNLFTFKLSETEDVGKEFCPKGNKQDFRQVLR